MRKYIGPVMGILCSFPLDNSPSRIIAIELDGGGYDGFITPSIGNLTELTIINLNKNQFRGPILDSIANLKKLIKISLSNNFLTGNIPRGLNALKRLESPNILFNALSGPIPSSVGCLRSLTFLSTSSNGFIGKIPDLSGWQQLRTLDLSRNQLYGDMPNVPSSLRTLILSHNILSGHLSQLNKLKQLRLLDVSDMLSSLINRDLFTLPKIVQLNVSINHFTTLEVVRFLGTETRLTVLDAQGNQLHDHLPLNLVTFPNSTTINLSYNKFYGHILDEYGARIGAPWKALYLDNNFLQGRLPPEFIANQGKIKGNLSSNCLRCQEILPMCFSGQRKVSECVEQNDSSG